MESFIKDKRTLSLMTTERKKVSRNFAIKNVFDWRPEVSHVALNLLRLESEGAVSFFKENREDGSYFCVINRFGVSLGEVKL